MFRATAAKLILFAFDTTTNTAKTGDAANITAYISKDYGSVTALGDTSATEMDATNAKGYYLVDVTNTEMTADVVLISAKSSTANIAVIGAPAVIFTRPATGWLAPTTAGRTLDVSAGGEAGVDWANVGSPTTAVDLSGTNIKTNQKVDVDTIKTNPVVNGGTITFPTTATLASTTNITAGTIATVTNVTTVNGLAAGVITAASIATGAIDADAIADGAIDAGALAADCITAAKLAADVTTELQSGLATAANLATVAGYLDTEIAAILEDTGTTLPAQIAALNNIAAADVWAVGARTLTAATNITSTGGTTVPQTGDSYAIVNGASGLVAIKAETAAILDDTDDIGVAGAGLTAINLPDQTMNITGDITGSLSGSVGSVTGAVGSVTGAVGSVTGAVGSVAGNVDGNVTGSVGSVVGLTASDVGAIKTKTDSLTFTVANMVDSNIQAVNDVTVTGNGQAGTEWGP